MNMTPIAQSLAAQGRGSDTMLVHMTPGEVKGLQALAMAHGGSLSINPATGLPEAGFLSRILPMIAGVALGPAGLGLSAMQAGLVVGGLGALATGSLGKGLMMGLGAGSGASLAGSVANLAEPAANLTSAAELGAGPQLATPTPDVIANQGVDFAAQQPLFQSQINTPALQAAQSNIDPGMLESGMSVSDVANAKVLPMTPNAPPTPMLDKLASGAKNIFSSPGSVVDFVKENPYSIAGTAMNLAYSEPTQPGKESVEMSPYELDIINTSGQNYPMTSAEREQLKYRFRALPTYKAAQGGPINANTAIRYAEGGDTSSESTMPTSALFSSYTTPAAPAAPAPTTSAGLPGLVSASAGDVYQNIARTQQMLGLPSLDTSKLNIAPRPTALQPMTFEEKQDALANRRIGDMFSQVLGRQATPEELREYTTKFGTTIDPTELRQFRNVMSEAGQDTLSSFRFPGMSDIDARAYFEANPGMSDAAYATWMKQSGVTPQQISDITGVPVEQVYDRYTKGIESGQGVIPEKPQGVSVADMFTSMLGRTGTPEEIAQWENIVGDTIDPKDIKNFRRSFKKTGATIYNKKPEGYVPPSKTPASAAPSTFTDASGNVSEEYGYSYDPRTGKFTLVSDPSAPRSFGDNVPNVPGMRYDRASNSYVPIDMGGSAAGGLLSAKKYAKGGQPKKDPRTQDPYDFADMRDPKAMSKAASRFNNGGLAGLNSFSAGGGRFLNGPGDGVSDSIPATIEGHQPARLADGEFVIDARTVSEIGNGSSKAGAKKLYAMMDRVHKARKKAKRGEPSNADKMLPA